MTRKIKLSNVEEKFKTFSDASDKFMDARMKENSKISKTLSALKKEVVLAMLKDGQCLRRTSYAKVGEVGERIMENYTFIIERKGSNVVAENYRIFIVKENGKVIQSECSSLRNEQTFNTIFDGSFGFRDRCVHFIPNDDGRDMLARIIQENIIGVSKIETETPKLDFREVVKLARKNAEKTSKQEIARREKNLKAKQKGVIKRIARKAMESL